MKKILLILLATTLVLLMLAGCVTKEANYTDEVEDKSPMEVYLLGGERLDSLIARDYSVAYNYTHQRPIKTTTFADAETMYDQIMIEMYAGGGPDIILINGASSQYLNLSKLSDQNAFADMDILIEKSESFDLNEYNTQAMDTGVINGKRIMLPMEYSVNYCVGIEECFDHHEIEVPEKLTMDSYLSTIEDYHKKNSNAPALLGIDEEYLLSEFYKEGEKLEKSDELRRLLDILKTEHERIVEFGLRDVSRSEWPYAFIDAHDYMYNNRFLYIGAVGQREDVYFRMFHLQYNTIKNYWEREALWFPQPFREGKPVEAYVEYGFAINNNSSHKNEAFNFVEYSLSKLKQTTANTIHFPVRKDSMDERKQEFSRGLNISYCDPWGVGAYGVHPDLIPDENVPEEMTEDFATYVDSAEEYRYIGHFKYVYYSIMKPSIEDYYRGYMSFDALIDEINNKLEIYYSE